MITFETDAMEINRLHSLAQASAHDAVSSAKAAGALLLELKRQMRHGEFVQWVKENINVSLRQAQRYMAVAQGRQIPLRKLMDKNDTVSHLHHQDNQGTMMEGDWVPTNGFLYVYCTDYEAYWVVPDIKSKGFHISRLYQCERNQNVNHENFADQVDPYDDRDWDGVSLYDGTKHPVRNDCVAGFLKYFGLKNPASVRWQSWAGEGLPRPFGAPEFEPEY